MKHVAARLVRLGYAVIPLDGRKRPLVKWKPYELTAPTREELISWLPAWHRALGVGVVCGRPHNLVVVDCDSALAWRWAQENLPTVRGVQTSRGGHLHFRHPDHGVIGNRTGPRAIIIDADVSLEVKGLGGLAVAPGSRHPSGITYLELWDWTLPVSALPVLPPMIAEQAEDRLPPPAPPPPPRRPGSDPVRAVENYLRKVGGVPKEGSGSDVLVFKAAAWSKRNAPDLREAEFVDAIRRERPEFGERWIASKWRSAGGEK